MNDPLVTILTPVRNGAGLIELTIDSIKRQSYKNIEYIVLDGGSTDSTESIVKSYGDVVTKFRSSRDSGMYDALAHGLSCVNGEIICYINAGDLLYPHAIEFVVSIFDNEKIKWLTGCRSICNEQGIVTHVDLPFRYKSNLIQAGSYGKRLPYIQQESTFWRSSLNKEIDLSLLRKLKFAGDYYLWICFSKVTELSIFSCPLGVFRKHRGQLSEAVDEYFLEVRSFSEKSTPGIFAQECFEAFFWALHPKIRSLMIQTVYRYDHSEGRWSKKYR
jgi:glycosyltransferase involved in cell wall biosynthesis